MNLWLNELFPKLKLRKKEGLYRNRNIVDSPQGSVISHSGKTYLNFSSNNYLGLANHPIVVKDFQTAAKKYGVGAGASHLLFGHQRPHKMLEEEIAKFTNRDRALVFSSGYMANFGIFSALIGRDDLIVQDKLNHASLIDGALASRGKLIRYKHNSIDDAERLLKKNEKSRKILAVDGVFSMDGDIAPLDKLSEICSRYDTVLMVDDAHALGTIGKTGRGSSELFNLDQQQLPILMGTLGKSFGVSGAFVAGSDDLIEYLIQYARSYIYTTAIPSASAVAACSSLKLFSNELNRLDHLNELVNYFKNQYSSLNYKFLPSDTPIQPMIVGDSRKATDISNKLFQHGIIAPAIRPPTVPYGSSRLRITLTASHTFSDIDKLIDILKKIK